MNTSNLDIFTVYIGFVPDGELPESKIGCVTESGEVTCGTARDRCVLKGMD